MDFGIDGLDGFAGRTALERVVWLAQTQLELSQVLVVEATSEGPICRARAAGGRLDLASVPLPGDLDRLPGVPLILSDGTLFGRLCYSAPADGLAEGAERFMAMLAELVKPELDQRRAAKRLREAIQELIESDGLDLAFQPIFELGTMRCLGVEALARFPKPFPPPDRMFAAAERVGLGLELEEMVVVQAWPVLGRLGPDAFLALNLTPPAVLTLAHRANQRPEVDLSGIVIEITEHSAIDAYADIRRELELLRERGLRIAVDDAGAGYASLRHILELQPDVLKIDRSLIHGLANDVARRAAVRSFLSLARDLGAIAVAEGVEREADLSAAHEMGLDAAQGYLLGRPSTDPAALDRWLSHPQREVASPDGDVLRLEPGVRRVGRTSSRAAGLSAG